MLEVGTVEIPLEVLDAARADSPVSDAVRYAALVTLWGLSPLDSMCRDLIGNRKLTAPRADEFQDYLNARIRFERMVAGPDPT